MNQPGRRPFWTSPECPDGQSAPDDTCQGVGYIRQQIQSVKFKVLQVRKMGKQKDMSHFGKGQIVMALDLQNSKSCVVFLGKEGQPVNRHQNHVRPSLIVACGEQRLACQLQSDRRATVAQITGKLNAGHDRKVSEHTVHHNLRLNSRRPVRVPMMPKAHENQQQTKEQ